MKSAICHVITVTTVIAVIAATVMAAGSSAPASADTKFERKWAVAGPNGARHHLVRTQVKNGRVYYIHTIRIVGPNGSKVVRTVSRARP
ncbi:hypothetical protein DPM19_00105 [Actinomadura craniellae]|uniref:PepSY domain-containing protein n=1 Tax=Actinomadura craniellae TaxID=2231787 RepID=A0A365HBY3_9ACTN|nr:hypothetical protein [Actinomadura craniellae]RAY16630.1 hypothetical protein DPM19_00105 [Actinomadura craniellae]